MKTDIRDYSTIKVTQKANFAVVELNRPEKFNALSPELAEDFTIAWSDVTGDDTVKSIIITGAGPSFCAGGDVEEDLNPLREMDPIEFHKYFREAGLFFKGVIDSEKPVIAAINGLAVGGGLDLALCCDIRIASEKAKMGEFFVKMGLSPDMGNYLLPRLVGPAWAKLLCFTGDIMNAAEAEKIGLVQKVVPPEELMPEAERLAKRLADGPAAIGFIKKAIHESQDMSLESYLDYITRMQYQLCHTKDHKEAVTAWLEKREPLFTGK